MNKQQIGPMADALSRFCLAGAVRDRRRIAAEVAVALGRYDSEPVYREMTRRSRLPRVQRALARIRGGMLALQDAATEGAAMSQRKIK